MMTATALVLLWSAFWHLFCAAIFLIDGLRTRSLGARHIFAIVCFVVMAVAAAVAHEVVGGLA